MGAKVNTTTNTTSNNNTMNVAYNFHKSSHVYRRSSAVLLPSSSSTNTSTPTTRADAKHGPTNTTAAITSLNHDETYKADADTVEYNNIHTRTHIGPIDTDLALGGAIPKYGFILRLVKR